MVDSSQCIIEQNGNAIPLLPLLEHASERVAVHAALAPAIANELTLKMIFGI